MRNLGLAIFLLLPLGCHAAEPAGPSQPGPNDWPQWRGPERDDVNRETGLLKDWPADGPAIAWKAKGLGGGYSTPSISAGRVFGMGFVDDDEVVWALNERTGDMLWSKRIAAKNSKYGYGEGSRSTPTVVGDVLYTLGIDGDLVCLKVADGDLVWHVKLKKEYGGSVGGWGYSESPLVDGDHVIVAAGGRDATIVALDRKDGKLVWKCKVPQGDHAHYASAIAADVYGVRQYIYFLSGGVVGVAANDGKFLWRYDKPHNGTANCSTPICSDNRVFAASNYGTGGGLVALTNQDGKFTADEVYFSKHMKNHHGGVILVDGYLYGSNDPGLLTCLDFKTGKLQWDDRKPGKGSIAYADGRLYCRDENSGDVFLVEAAPTKYSEHGRLKQPDRSGHNAWPHPVIANGRLYLRDQDVMFVYDIKEKK
jgi:outer membrane protein assembly factor BamB